MSDRHKVSNSFGFRIQELVIYEMHKIMWTCVTNTNHIPLLTQWSLVKYCFQSKIFIASKKCCLFYSKICWILCFYLTTVYVQFIHKICNLWYARRTKKLIGIAVYRLSHTIAMDSVWLIHITDDCNCNIFSSVFPLTEPFNWLSRKQRRFFPAQIEKNRYVVYRIFAFKSSWNFSLEGCHWKE